MAQKPTRRVNWFAIITTAAVAVVVVVIGVIALSANQKAGPAPTASVQPRAAAVNTETGAIAVGTGPRQLDTYIDFMCPICNRFEQAYGPTIQQQLDAGTITLNIHPISILDSRSQGTKYSTRAASAAYCVAEAAPTAVQPFVAAMYAQQPAEGTTGLTDDQIAQIASDAGAPGAADCIRAGTYTAYVTAQTPKTPLQAGATGIGTPTVALDGTVVTLTSDPAADITARLR